MARAEAVEDGGSGSRRAAAAGGQVTLASVAMLCVLSLAWGSFWPVMKLAVSAVPVFSFRALTGLVGGAILLSIAVALRRPLRVPRGDWGKLLVFSIFGTSGWMLCSAFGVLLIGSGRAVLLAYTMPLFAFLFGIWLLKEKPTAARWAGLAVGLAGIGVMVGQDLHGLREQPWGFLVMLLGALSWAFGGTIYKYFHWRTDQYALVGWQMLLGTLPIVVLALLIDPLDPSAFNGSALFATLYTAIVGNALGVFLWFRLLRSLPVAVASLGVLMVPVVGLTGSALIVHEAIGWAEVTALCLLVLGLTAVLPLPRLPWSRRAG